MTPQKTVHTGFGSHGEPRGRARNCSSRQTAEWLSGAEGERDGGGWAGVGPAGAGAAARDGPHQARVDPTRSLEPNRTTAAAAHTVASAEAHLPAVQCSPSKMESGLFGYLEEPLRRPRGGSKQPILSFNHMSLHVGYCLLVSRDKIAYRATSDQQPQ